MWPGQPISAHWGVPDPSKVEGPIQEQEKAFMNTALILKRRIDLMLALPPGKLAGMSLRRELEQIGKTAA